ncbi:MAG: PAS domain S-box protein [Magnetococcus sp. WYHC-3]
MAPTSRHFAIVGMGMVVAALLALGLLLRADKIATVLATAERHNLRLGEFMGERLWPRFGSHISGVSRQEGVPLGAHPEVGPLRETVLELVAGTPVLRVRVMDLSGVVVFSPRDEELGHNAGLPLPLLQAVQEGRAEHHHGWVSALDSLAGPVLERRVATSWLPLHTRLGSVGGLLELTTDVTSEWDDNTRRLVQLLFWSGGILAALLGAFLWMLHRDRRSLEAQYREWHQRQDVLRGILENTPDAVVVMDRNGALQEFNPAAAALLGVDAEVARRRSFFDLACPDGGRELVRLLESMPRDAAGGYRPGRGDMPLARGDGTIFDAEWTLVPLLHGDTRLFALLLRDLAERNDREQENQWLRAAVEQNPSAMVITDRQGWVLFANAQVSRVTGFSPEELRGRRCHIFSLLGDVEERRGSLERVYASGGEWRGEISGRRKDGTPQWLHVVFHSLRGREAGPPEHFVVIQEDVTLRRQQEQTAQAREVRARMVQDAMEEGCIAVDERGAITHVNAAAARLLGWSAEQVVGRAPLELFLHADGTVLPPGNSPLDGALQGESHRGAAALLRRADNLRLPVSLVTRPLVENGAVVGAVLVFRALDEPMA